jgi:hypothetical protein
MMTTSTKKNEPNRQQIKEIKNSLKEADNNDFASDAEVSRIFRQWGVKQDQIITDSTEKS